MTLLDSPLTLAYLFGGLTFVPILLVIRFMATWLVRVAWPRNSKLPQQFASHQESLAKTDITDQHYRVGNLHVVCGQHQKPHESAFGEIVKYITRSSRRFEKEYYATLKSSTLYLYDSEKQQDCKYVVILDNYHVSIHPPSPDHELFSRPQTILLQPTSDPTLNNYYINCSLCSEKEDWYFALLRASRHAKTSLPHYPLLRDPTHFDQAAMNQLIASVYSAEQHSQNQWFNALLGRVFCAIYKTETVKTALYRKVVSKMDKLNAKLPSLIGDITVRSVDPGQALPQITDPKLIGLSPSGELTAEASMQYFGNFRVEVATALKLSPGVAVDIALAITLKELHGKFMVKIKEPPSNRLWYGFYELPKMEWRVEPMVSKKPVGYPMVVEAIVTRLAEVVRDTMVLPDMDDMTFFPADGAGGIFADPPEPPPSLLVSSPVPCTKRRPWFSPSSSAPSSPMPTPSVSNNTAASYRDLLDFSSSPPQPSTLGHIALSHEDHDSPLISTSPCTLTSSLDSMNSAPALSLGDSSQPSNSTTTKDGGPTTPSSSLVASEPDPSLLMPDGMLDANFQQRKLRKASSSSLITSAGKSSASIAISPITVSPAVSLGEPSGGAAHLLERKKTASIA